MSCASYVEQDCYITAGGDVIYTRMGSRFGKQIWVEFANNTEIAETNSPPAHHPVLHTGRLDMITSG